MAQEDYSANISATDNLKRGNICVNERTYAKLDTSTNYHARGIGWTAPSSGESSMVILIPDNQNGLENTSVTSQVGRAGMAGIWFGMLIYGSME